MERLWDECKQTNEPLQQEKQASKTENRNWCFAAHEVNEAKRQTSCRTAVVVNCCSVVNYQQQWKQASVPKQRPATIQPLPLGKVENVRPTKAEWRRCCMMLQQQTPSSFVWSTEISCATAFERYGYAKRVKRQKTQRRQVQVKTTESSPRETCGWKRKRVDTRRVNSSD